MDCDRVMTTASSSVHNGRFPCGPDMWPQAPPSGRASRREGPAPGTRGQSPLAGEAPVVTVRKSLKMHEHQIGAPRLEPKYNFAAHLEHLGMVLASRRPSNRDLYAYCNPSMKHIGFRQFMQQLRGRANHHRLL